ncbi:hypothetical protein K457DRAFT_648998 [Linnemannia elongata AG-77]|uniref:Uncharacterized protein n=1 Tax=Linnemannia elongata AG-77 TaxID=1314771 RepID=A0A197KEK4_9FUNG|nr:hypothetical protein K457DRAFT_648998 [Linnemannia elongata AG-77]
MYSLLPSHLGSYLFLLPSLPLDNTSWTEPANRWKKGYSSIGQCPFLPLPFPPSFQRGPRFFPAENKSLQGFDHMGEGPSRYFLCISLCLQEVEVCVHE